MDRHRKSFRWRSFWFSNDNTSPELPDSGCSRGSKRERLRRVLSQKLKHSRPSKELTPFFKRSNKHGNAPITSAPNLIESPLSVLETKVSKAAVSAEDRQGSVNGNSQAHGGGAEETKEAKTAQVKNQGNNIVSPPSLNHASVAEHTLLSKIRSKWLKPDASPKMIEGLSRKPIPFLHEMRPGVTTTEISYTNA